MKIKNTSFNLEAIAGISKEEFISSHQHIKGIDLGQVWESSQPKNTNTIDNGNSESARKKSFKNKGKSADEGNTEKPRGESQDHSAEHAESTL